NTVNDNDVTDNGNDGGGLVGGSSGNGSGEGLLKGAASGNGEHNYGICNFNGDDVYITSPITGVFFFSFNSFSIIGNSSSSSINT
ncbi:hypothetical protein CKJ99_20290, partial [Acinetobacter baumannii]|uniref:hypothetical protein n=1 Tax=Acinetobacter baumannii TaxID=470 RepID=UPI0016523D5B